MQGTETVIVLSREGVTLHEPLSMFLYGIILVPLPEKLFAAAPELPEPFYVDDATFDGQVDRSVRLLTLILEWGVERGYLPELAKKIFVCDYSSQEEMANRAFSVDGLEMDVLPGS